MKYQSTFLEQIGFTIKVLKDFHTVTNIWYYFAGLHDICIMGEAASAASTNPQYSQLQVTGKVLPNELS